MTITKIKTVPCPACHGKGVRYGTKKKTKCPTCKGYGEVRVI